MYRKTFAHFGVNDTAFANCDLILILLFDISSPCFRFGLKSKPLTAARSASGTNGPAWLSWSRGQSMHGVGAHGQGAPEQGVALTRGWMAAQHSLQKQILERMRAIGIVPILPAFQGPPRPRAAAAASCLLSPPPSLRVLCLRCQCHSDPRPA